ncbi:MAG: hypothetical protein KAI64_07680, partial [Thermoplasmata archaeon]|nr:hypothetical protein [Thermoplasmata archaeon]
MERDDPTLNERIGNVLRSFADRVRDVFRGGAGSGHHAHAGRPGEVGGSAPSGVAVAEKPKYERVQHSIEEFRNAGGTLYRIDAGRERNVNAWRKEHQDILDRAMQEVEYYGSATGFNQELPGLHIAKHRRKFRRFYILPDGRLFLVRDHDEVAEHVVVESLLHFSAMDELKDATGQLGFGSPKDTMLTIGFVRGGFDVLNRDDDNPALHELDLQFDTPLTSEARRTIKDLMALEPERLWFDANGISGKSDSDLNRLVARTLEEKGGEGSGHHDHAGRPSEVGGSAPSGVAAIGEYDPDPRYEDYDTREGKRFRIDTDREHLIDQFRKDHPEYMSDAMDMIERYQPTRGFGAGERFVREAPALNLWEYGRSFGRFFIFPDGRFFLVKDHDEIGDTVSLDLQAKYGTLGRTMELQNENASVFGKKGLVTLGFIRGGWSQSNDPSPESLTHFSFQFETPVSSAARRTIKDLIAINPNVNLSWDAGTRKEILSGYHQDDLMRLISRTTEDEQTEGDMKVTVRGPLRRIFIEEGGEGSGHHGHAGRPGEKGGSLPSGEVSGSGNYKSASAALTKKYNTKITVGGGELSPLQPPSESFVLGVKVEDGRKVGLRYREYKEIDERDETRTFHEPTDAS